MGPPRESPLEAAVVRVGDRWSLLVVEALLEGPRRFGELLESLAGIAPNILSHRLKHLEKEGLVLSRPYSERPLRLEYELSATGGELAGALRLLAQWGARTAADTEPGLRHEVCGTALVARWYCPTCARLVEDREGVELHRL
ncbi:MAG: winged helix-turn-helix transcriptional regulator [Actinomycetota bacterium]